MHLFVHFFFLDESNHVNQNPLSFKRTLLKPPKLKRLLNVLSRNTTITAFIKLNY